MSRFRLSFLLSFLLSFITSVACLAVSLPVVHGQAQPTRDVCRLEQGGVSIGPGADICAGIARRWALLIPTPASPGVVRIAPREGYRVSSSAGGWVLESPPPGEHAPSDSRYRKSDGLLHYFAEDVIPHEAGHHVFAVYFGVIGGAAPPDRYGTAAPDWLDEAFAVWMESQGERERRGRGIRRTQPSLAALVTMTHPGQEFIRDNALNADFTVERVVTPPCAPKCTWLPDSLQRKYMVSDRRVDASGRGRTVVWYSDRPPDKTETMEQRGFYPLSYSLLRFIRLRGGSAAVQELVRRYRENQAPRVEAFAALPGLPASVGALEKAWHEFLVNPPPEDR